MVWFFFSIPLGGCLARSLGMHTLLLEQPTKARLWLKLWPLASTTAATLGWEPPLNPP